MIGVICSSVQFQWESPLYSYWLLAFCNTAEYPRGKSLWDRNFDSLRKDSLVCSVFFAFVHPNYAPYITVYLLLLINLEESHPEANTLLLGNRFSVNRSDVPRSRSAVDITIEQTIKHHAKPQGGIIGFSRIQSVCYRWCKTRQTRASFL